MGRVPRVARHDEVDPAVLAFALAQDEATETFDGWLRIASPELRWDLRHLVFIREALDRVTAGEVKRLAIAVPPQHGKSSLATIRYPVWRIIRDPRLRVIVGSYNEDQAAEFSREARKIAAPWVSFAEDINRANQWQTTAGGGLLSVGTTGGTGKPAEIFIVDDPFKDRADADSLQRREAVWSWYTEVVLSRRPQAIVLIQTRWHEDDLMGRVLARTTGTPWTHVRLPAIAEDEGDLLGRAPGEALCPELMTLEQLLEQKEINPFSFESLYQGAPSPREGNLAQVTKLIVIPRKDVPEGLARVRAWDLAASVNDKADETAGVLVTGPSADGIYYILEVVHGHWEPAERNRIIRATAERDGYYVGIWGPEDPGPHGHEAAQAFIKTLDGFSASTHSVLHRQGSRPDSKALRAEPFIAQVNGGMVRLVEAPWNAEYIDQLRRFPAGRRDDMVDATALGYAALRNERAPGDYGIF